MPAAAPKLESGTELKPVAEHLAKKQREISVSEFFAKNRHLLGFDNPRKALLTTVKEAVDNSLDACEEAKILPEVEVRVEVAGNGNGQKPPPSQAERFVVTITDNGPGIVKQQIPRVFGKLLYGSKFHRLRMSRGQQGIGISAAGMYSLLTTGKPIRITSRIGPTKKAHYFELQIDTTRNEPNILKDDELDWDRPHGTKVELEIVGKYQKGRLSVDEYLEQTAIANPHLHLIYVDPEGNKVDFPRSVTELPREPKEIKPHPYGVELGVLMKMLQDTSSRTLSGFLQADFSRVSSAVAQTICQAAGLEPNMRPSRVAAQEAETLHKAIQTVKIMNPPTDVLSPIGEKAILAGLYKQIKGDFYTAVSRSPAVYRGNPFTIEVGLAFGTGQASMTPKPEEESIAPVAEGEKKEEEVQLARLMRFANRVPLLYQQGACAVYKAVVDTAWRNYGVAQSRGALPQGPLVVLVHMASVWVPFTSESKEAIADYDEIRKEIKLALQEAGRRLSSFIRRRERAHLELKRRDIFEAYIEEVAAACKRLKKGKLDDEKLRKQLSAIAHSKTGGLKTDEAAGKKEDGQPAEESTIIVTPEGPVGAVPVAEPEPVTPQIKETKNEPKLNGRGQARRPR